MTDPSQCYSGVEHAQLTSGTILKNKGSCCRSSRAARTKYGRLTSAMKTRIIIVVDVHHPIKTLVKYCVTQFKIRILDKKGVWLKIILDNRFSFVYLYS